MSFSRHHNAPDSLGRVAVIGLGYVGLSVAVAAAERGWDTIGYDVDPLTVDAVNAGVSPVTDICDDRLIASGLRASASADAMAAFDVAVICVPTPLDSNRQPDLSAIRRAGESLAAWLRPGALVVLESTTYPGTTEELLLPLLEINGLRAGADFALAFSPERIDPGNRTWTLANTPKVVGGHTPECTDQAEQFYSTFVDEVVRVRGTREAETAKLLENTYRHVNIALVNELARVCHELGIDIWDVVRAAGTKPFGFASFQPGPGVGGHCIPIDPNYLSWRVRAELGYPFRMVELAQEINEAMPEHVARQAQDLLNDQHKSINGAQVLLLGVTYKPDVTDQRESPAVPLAVRLRKLGAEVTFHDPYVDAWSPHGHGCARVDDPILGVESADLTILLQGHSNYDLDRIADQAKLLLDTRGLTTGAAVARL